MASPSLEMSPDNPKPSCDFACVYPVPLPPLSIFFLLPSHNFLEVKNLTDVCVEGGEDFRVDHEYTMSYN